MKEHKFEVGDKVNRKFLKKYKNLSLIGTIKEVREDSYIIHEDGIETDCYLDFTFEDEFELYVPWIYNTKRYLLSLFRRKKKKNRKFDKFRNQAAVTMMHAMLTNKELSQYEGAYGVFYWIQDKEIAEKAVRYADALIEELKKDLP